MAKTESDSLKKLSVSFLKKQGYLDPNCFKSGSVSWSWNGEPNGSISVSVSTFQTEEVRLVYTQTDYYDDKKKNFDYKVKLTKTPCYFGGYRYWFVCPLYSNGIACRRRVGTLYKGGDYFGCRHCYNLTYNSRNLSGYWKRAGASISIPDIEEIENNITTKYYAGKPTRKYKSYLKKLAKFNWQLEYIGYHI